MKEKINLIKHIIEINNKYLFTDLKDYLKNNIESDLQQEEDKISEMKFHKILYILYGNYYAKYQEELFKDARFEAWQNGPIEADFQTSFHTSKIDQNPKFNIEIDQNQKIFLFKMILKALRFSTWSLVQFTIDTDPWLIHYDSKSPTKKQIPNQEIQTWFKNNQLD